MLQRLPKIFISHPLPAWLGLATLAYGGYFGGRWLSYAPLHLTLTSLSGMVYAICVLFSPFLIYLTAYLRGWPLRKRLLNAGAIPFLWLTKDVLILTASHPLIECLYWYFNPMYIFYTCGVCIEIGLATLLGRALLQRRGIEIQVYSPAAAALISVALLIVIAIYSWGQGENLHALYLEVYRQLYGGGL